MISLIIVNCFTGYQDFSKEKLYLPHIPDLSLKVVPSAQTHSPVAVSQPPPGPQSLRQFRTALV